MCPSDLPVPPGEEEYLPWYKTACQWICGTEKMQGDAQQLTEEEARAIEAKQTSIHEDKKWRRILNVNAVLLMTLAAFMWGFFA